MSCNITLLCIVCLAVIKTEVLGFPFHGMKLAGNPTHIQDIENDKKTTCMENDRTCPEQNIHLNHENNNLFEGDIYTKTVPGMIAKVQNDKLPIPKTWAGGKVYYEFDHSFEDRYKPIVKDSMTNFTKRVGEGCIEFKEVADCRDCGECEQSCVTIKQGQGCYSAVGVVDLENQVLSISPEVLKQTSANGTIFHELMHTLGFYHEHNRNSRDYFIKVILENIEFSYAGNFIKRSEEEEFSFYSDETGFPYDFGSVLHYSRWAFSKSPTNEKGKASFTVQTPAIACEITIGQRKHLSKNDVRKIRKAYKCESLPDEIDNDYFDTKEKEDREEKPCF